jgi:glucose-6-phosphate isomerase
MQTHTLGKSTLSVDFDFHSCSPLLHAPTSLAFELTWKHLQSRFNKDSQASGAVGFYQSVIDPKISQIQESLTLAEELKRSKLFKNVLCLGIGGSSLGPISLLSSLKSQCDPELPIQFLENPDPMDLDYTLKTLNPEQTLVVVIAKSGTTFETLAQFMCTLKWLTPARWQSHIVAITDPHKGDLRQFCNEQKIRTLSLTSSIGGRFSIFSPVGFFPAALASLDLKAFIQGAQDIREYCESTPLDSNVLFKLSSLFIENYKQYPLHVFMPYSSALKSFSSWFVQLWAESLGKNLKGFTPLACLGPVDQHSILQLLRDGPQDKFIWFTEIKQMKARVQVPRLQETSHLAAFNIIEGVPLLDLMNIEKKAIEKVMTNQKRPHFSFKLETIDERNIGAYTFALCVLTAFTGTLWGVDPFDQPGVEEGKIYIKESLKNLA